MYGDATDPANAYGSQAGEAWAAGATGSTGVAVGVVDSGVDYTHPDLYLNIWLNYGEIPTSFRGALRDADGDARITFRDLNAIANAGYVSDLNANGRIDGGDLIADGRWVDGRDSDGNGYRDDLIGWDFANNDNNPMDDNGHGTHVAGTIGGIGGNGFGVAWVAWSVQMVPLKFLDANGSGTSSAAAAALDYFTNASKTPWELDFVATNNSWGGGGYTQQLADAITRGATHDILFVAAAGNGGADTVGDDNDALASYPSNYSTMAVVGVEAVVAVAALTSTGARASFSNYGATTVDIAAPGQSIYSTLPGGRCGTMSGTSMATPHVTGAIALYAATHPGASGTTIRADLLGSAVATQSFAGLTVTGGRLDVASFVGGADQGLTVNGASGNDSLTGGAEADTLNGLAGHDVLNGMGGADRMTGGAGNDIYYVDDAGDAVIESANGGFDSVHSTISYTLPAETDRLYLDGGADLDGAGTALANLIYGNAGANRIAGLGGNDQLFGQAGADTLVGGAGADRFDWNSAAEAGLGGGADQVLDFTRGSDKLDLSGVDAVAGAGGDQGFRFIGGAAFSGAVGELHSLAVSGGMLVQGDVNGDRIADFEILLSGMTAPMQSADFVL